MKIVMLGAGAIGSLFGGYLARENDVTLVCRKDHADAVNAKGLAITGLSKATSRPKAVHSVAGLESPEILFLTVKAYDTAKAIGDIRKLKSSNTTLVSLQNGLGNLELLRDAFPDSAIVAGITSQAAILRKPGTVEHTGISYTVVGECQEATKVAQLLNSAGLETTVSADIMAEIWYKAIVNSAINPVATLLGDKNRIISERQDLAPLVEAIVKEGAAVAASRGVALDRAEALAKVMKVARETADNVCSMRLDMENGRRTEIMQMNGAIASYGAEAGVPTPANDIMATLVRAMGPKAYHY